MTFSLPLSPRRRRLFGLGCGLALAVTGGSFTVRAADAAPAAATVAAPLTAEAVRPVLETYAQIVYLTYKDSHATAEALLKSVDAFVATPTDETLAAAKAAWIAARVPYGQTEAFRFYGGPIDGDEGLETQINAWPLNEAYIDYVKGAPTSGIISMTETPITAETLVKSNMKHDEKDVSTGYHAVEFLLWGQDESVDGPGARPVSDYLPGDAIRERRGLYLKLVTKQLVDDLATLVVAWEPATEGNFRAEFVKRDPVTALGQVMSGMATLSGFELAAERINTAIDSGDQEDEQSCFSDNTPADVHLNAQGIRNIYFGTYGDFKGPGLATLVEAGDAAENQRMLAAFEATDAAIAAMPKPMDAALATPEGSPEKARLKAVVTALYAQTDALKSAGKSIGVNVVVVAE